MKTFSITVLFATLAVSQALADAEGGMGYVDIRKALETVEVGKSAKTQLEKEVQAKQGELEKAKASLEKEAESFQKRAAILNETARKTKEQELNKKFMDLQKNAAESQMVLQKRDRELTEPIINDLKAIVEAIAKEKKYDFVLEKNESGVLYANNDRDITSTVIERFNAKNKSKKK